MKSYYDTIPNFKYWDVEAWKEYIQKYIVPIYENTKYLLELKDELSLYVGKTLETLRENNKDLMPFFVGGIDEEGNYEESSIARLIYLMFGIYIEPKVFIGEGRLKEAIITSKNEDEWTFLRFLKEMNECSLNIIKKSEIKLSSIKIDDTIQNPSKILEILNELYKGCVSFNASYNYYTFFIVSAMGVHWKYLISTYPKLNEYDGIKEFLGFHPMFVPDAEDEFKKDYTIWRYKNEGIASNLFAMQLYLWYLFDFINYDDYKEIFGYVIEDPKNLREEFRKLVKTTLGCEGEITIKNIKINPKDVYLVAIEKEYIIKWPKKEVVDRFYDAFERRWKLSHYFRREYEIPFEEERSKPKILLSDFLDEVAPFLFLKLAYFSLSMFFLPDPTCADNPLKSPHNKLIYSHICG
ncbi:hypothetical protein [Methanotorris igneus]|uniref:Uncharacterized protein n=1 Tax=Methanotorris igneus (strain DSM 5666 / JCM 11834 / Kol 5) TaxID=880724 RepID=F6BC12_METIK|nr:hypothetical protein [Methanotorris igneus]AEF96093.1 hypothetical protein Metig_0538 [Methanotorris igneus Kol 5]